MTPRMTASMAAETADIDATIRHWQDGGVTAGDIGRQLRCGRSWYKIRRRMIVMTAPRREHLPETTLIALIGARKRRGLTQQQIAERVGVCQVSISDYETRQTAPSPKTLAAWRVALGLRPAPVRLAA